MAEREEFEQLSPLMEDVKMAIERSRGIVPNALDANAIFIAVQGDLLQLTFEYLEQCARIMEAAMRRMRPGNLQ